MYYKPAYVVAGAATAYGGRIAQRYAYRPSGSYTRTQVTGSARSKYRKGNSFAQKVRSLAPYKHTYLNDDVYLQTVTHNSINCMAITPKVTVGTGNDQRIGDSIVPVSLKISGEVHTDATAGAYMFRVIVFWSGEEFNPTGLTTGVFTAPELFLTNSGTFYLPNAIVNPKAITVLHDELIDINSQISATNDVRRLKFSVPLGSKKFPYQAGGSVYGKTRNLYLMVTGARIGAVAGNAVGGCTINADMVFQD